MTSIKRPFIIVLWLMLPMVSTAGNVSIGGYYKSFFTAYNLPRIDEADVYPVSTSDYGNVANRLRVNAGYAISDIIRLDISYNVIPQIRDLGASGISQRESSLSDNSLTYRLDDLDRQIYPSLNDSAGSFVVHQNLDRLNVSLAVPFADIIIGRQAVAWGSARIINPTDVIAPYAYQELDTEDRVGVDAVRVRIPLGFMSEIDAGYITSYKGKFENSAVFLRGKCYPAKTDISASLVGFREHLMLGLDLARSVGGAGVWAEGAYVFNKALSENERNRIYDYFRLSVGTDYSLTGRLYGFIEYHFNEAGESNPDEYTTLSSHPAYTEGATYLLGRHYITPAASYQLTPLVTISGEVLCNLNDPSAFLSLQAEYNIAQNVYLSLGAFIGLGDNPELVLLDDQSGYIAFPGEFGSYTDIIYSSFRFYF